MREDMIRITVLMLAAAVAGALSPGVYSQETSSSDKGRYVPEIHGTVRAKYEYEPEISKGRFEVRNARVSVEGKVVPKVSYKAEIDLSDEGTIKMLDAYVRYKPVTNVKLTAG